MHEEVGLTKNQHAAILILQGALLVVTLLLAGIYLPAFWFGVIWVVLGLGGWSFSYYIRLMAPGWEIVPAVILGPVAMLYYLDQFIREG